MKGGGAAAEFASADKHRRRALICTLVVVFTVETGKHFVALFVTISFSLAFRAYLDTGSAIDWIQDYRYEENHFAMRTRERERGRGEEGRGGEVDGREAPRATFQK